MFRKNEGHKQQRMFTAVDQLPETAKKHLEKSWAHVFYHVARTGKEITNKRASIESTVRSVIHPFGGHLCKMPVRGQHRITTMIVLSAMMVNIKRITGYLFPEDGKNPVPDGYALC